MRVSACASVCRCGGEARKSAEGGGGGTSVAAIHRTEGWKGKGSAPSTARARPPSGFLLPRHSLPLSPAPAFFSASCRFWRAMAVFCALPGKREGERERWRG